MKKILGEIQSGQCDDEGMAECEGGKEKLKALEAEGEGHQIEDVGKRLRAMMPWLAQDKLVDAAKN